MDTEVHTEVVSNISADDRSNYGIVTDNSTRSRSWFITINNPTADEITKLESDDWTYMIYQHETGLECGTPHIHALIYYKNARIWPKKKFMRADIRKPFNLEAVIKYCSKEETRTSGPFEFGVKPVQGKRNDLEDMAKKILSKELTVQEFAEEDPVSFLKYSKGLTVLETMTFSHRSVSNPPNVIWLWGLSGTGKTRTAVEIDQSFYIKDGTQWWDGYKQQKVIIIDDFDGKWPYRDLLRLLDRYPYQGQIKGGYMPINSEFIVITCEHPPEFFWVDNELIQVTRRISEVRKCE